MTSRFEATTPARPKCPFTTLSLKPERVGFFLCESSFRQSLNLKFPFTYEDIHMVRSGSAFVRQLVKMLSSSCGIVNELIFSL